MPGLSAVTIPAKLFGLTDFEHLGTTGRAGTRRGGSLILHYDSFGTLHLPLSSAFNTICFHSAPPFERNNILFCLTCQVR